MPATLKTKQYGGIDVFRIIAALLIVGVHTSPLQSLSEELHYGIFRIFARIGVPFFLMVTGYFTLPGIMTGKSGSAGFPVKFLKKSLILYAIATLIYLPVSIYAGYYAEGNIAVNILKNIIFDGTFYHLWYLPASIIGVLLLYALSRKAAFKTIFVMTIILYVFGLLGDSYYGFTEQIPVLKSAYSTLFRVFDYTRNGIFYAPVFLMMGASMAQKTDKETQDRRQCVFEPVSTVGFIITATLMLCEGFTLRKHSIPMHDSMYIMLLPCMYFLFKVLLGAGGKSSAMLRDVSLWIYILHPLCIIGIRGVAGITGLTGLLVENDIINYLAVCASSLACGLLIIAAQQKIAERKSAKRKTAQRRERSG